MYRIRGGYLLRQIVGEWVAVAIGGDAAGGRAFMELNETGALIWQMLESGAELRNHSRPLMTSSRRARLPMCARSSRF